MSEIQTAIATIGNIIGFERNEVIEKITEFNKNKVYPVSLIDIKISADGVTDNSDEIGELVEKLQAWVSDVTKNTLDAQSVADAKKTLSEIGKFLIETRKLQTNPLKEVASHYTKHESHFKTMNESLTAKFEAINEIEYQSRAKAITVHFQELIAGDDLTEVVSIDAFKDFIANKRKTNIFTSTGKLSKGIKDAVTEALRLVVEPIKQAKELEEKKALQSKTFETYLENVVADGETQMLEANINTLIRMKESVGDLYPDIKEHCMRSIDNKISRCEANIKANKAIAEKDKVKNADGDLMLIFDEINTISQDMMLDIESLKELGNQLRGIYPKLTFSENQEKCKSLGVSINQRITELEIAENTPEPVVEEEVILEAKYSLTAKYFISISDLEFIANVGVEANSEEDAKNRFTEMFRNHLNMVGLMKGE